MNPLKSTLLSARMSFLNGFHAIHSISSCLVLSLQRLQTTTLLLVGQRLKIPVKLPFPRPHRCPGVHAYNMPPFSGPTYLVRRLILEFEDPDFQPLIWFDGGP